MPIIDGNYELPFSADELIDDLVAMYPPATVSDPAQVATEAGRLELARAIGRHDVAQVMQGYRDRTKSKERP